MQIRQNTKEKKEKYSEIVSVVLKTDNTQRQRERTELVRSPLRLIVLVVVAASRVQTFNFELCTRLCRLASPRTL